MGILSKVKSILGDTDVNRPEIEYRCVSCKTKYTIREGDKIECPECESTSATTVDPQIA